MNLPKIIIIMCVFVFAASVAPAETLIWSDEFDGSAVATDAWNYDVGGGIWGNQELCWYTDGANVSVAGGSLNIEARPERVRAQKFTSARLNTLGKVQFQYGHVVARINMPDLADGLWPAWWTMGVNGGWPDCGELDVVEMGSAAAIAAGTVNRTVGSTAHWSYFGDYAGYGLTYDATNDLNGSFHVFEMQWTPTMIDTYIDGQHIWAFDISDPASFSGEEFHQPHYMILNLAVGGTFTGITSETGITAPLPANMLVDYIRLYDNGFTTNVTIPGGSDPVCGDGTCDPGEDQCNCSDDCGTPPATETNCTDGIDEDCDGGADCQDPTGDCDADPACLSSYCGDGTCDPGEDQCNCSDDCGTPPSSETTCDDGIDEDCDGSTDCDDIDCDGDPACPSCAAVGEYCEADTDCCSGNCFERKNYCKN